VINLLSNAVKFTDSGAVKLALSCRPGAGQAVELVLEVEDSGIGFPEERRAEIFERFTQLEAPMTKTRGGTGLGLAIVRELTGLMGGSVEVKSSPGAGSTFTVRVPATRLDGGPAPKARPGPEEGDPGRRGQQRWAGNGRRVLVVEDNQINLLYLKAMLDREGYVVEAASNGREAVEKAQASGFALILMDIQMPEMDGIEALARIRAIHGADAGPPVFALTGYAMEEDQKLLLARGFALVVTKPIKERQLLRLIHEWTLAGPGPEDPLR
jgi:CheY-like chemotaxis protein